jgi:hypothetical protein
MLHAIVVALLFADGSSADAGVCDPQWKVKASGCEYSMGSSPGGSYGDTAWGPINVIAIASCGERVTVCGVERVCRCGKSSK